VVWLDSHIGEPMNNLDLKRKFIKELQSLPSESENDTLEEDISYLTPHVLYELQDEAFALKLFSNEALCLKFIIFNANRDIFFITSGSSGKSIVPKIASLQQIRAIYIFCGNISHHTEWAGDYVDNITAILEHQDNLLERLTRDIALYVEKKGDEYTTMGESLKARNCYAWAMKLLIRGRNLGDTGANKLIEKIETKIEGVQTSAACECSN